MVTLDRLTEMIDRVARIARGLGRDYPTLEPSIEPMLAIRMLISRGKLRLSSVMLAGQTDVEIEDQARYLLLREIGLDLLGTLCEAYGVTNERPCDRPLRPVWRSARAYRLLLVRREWERERRDGEWPRRRD